MVLLRNVKNPTGRQDHQLGYDEQNRRTTLLLEDAKKCREISIGYLYWQENLVATITEGMEEGRNRNGKPRMRYIKQIKEKMRCQTYQKMKRFTEKHVDKLLHTSLQIDNFKKLLQFILHYKLQCLIPSFTL